MPTNDQKVLQALALLQQSTGNVEVCKKKVAGAAQITSSTFPPLITRMVKKGVIEYGSGSGTIKITEKGLAMVGDLPDMPTSNEEHHEEIKKKLKGKGRLIFEYLADGKAHKKEDVMDAVDCTNPKTFAPLLSRELKKPGYIHYPEKGKVQLTDDCFPFGRH